MCFKYCIKNVKQYLWLNMDPKPNCCTLNVNLNLLIMLSVIDDSMFGVDLILLHGDFSLDNNQKV